MATTVVAEPRTDPGVSAAVSVPRILTVDEGVGWLAGAACTGTTMACRGTVTAPRSLGVAGIGRSFMALASGVRSSSALPASLVGAEASGAVMLVAAAVLVVGSASDAAEVSSSRNCRLLLLLPLFCAPAAVSAPVAATVIACAPPVLSGTCGTAGAVISGADSAALSIMSLTGSRRSDTPFRSSALVPKPICSVGLS